MRGYLTMGMAAGFLLASTILAMADDVPVLNVKPVCRGIADQSAEPSERGGPDLAFDQCVQSEQSVRQELAKQWSSFGASDKMHCTKEATMGGEASYTDLLTCLEMARDVKALNPNGSSKPTKTN
jgi:hypothetical protein